jgi:Protein of unknown function (DUF1501)
MIPTSTQSRRQLLQTTASGFGYLAFSALHGASAGGPLATKETHFTPKAKRVIFLCMAGGPSHVDMLDYKPKLQKASGSAAPVAAGRNGRASLLGSQWQFSQHGRSGLWISELLPNLAKHADDLCVINSMSTDVPAHPQAFMQMHTGTSQFVRPSMGSWLLYGLGTSNENLPGFIALNPPANGSRAFGSAFLPAVYQATKVRDNGIPGQGAGRFGGGSPSVSNIKNSRLTNAQQQAQLELIQSLNQESLKADGGVSAEIDGVIDSYELAFRMQGEVPKVMDLSQESEATKALYGIGEQGTDEFGKQCLLARKFSEAGVRFIEVTHGNWDQHRNLKADLEKNCAAIDKPIHGLLTDLKQRGLLKDTLVVWGGEFGRTPHGQASDGRDHNHKGFTMWMAGGGVKGGMNYGATDDYGYEAVENKMHIHDWHATVLHLMGLDHERLTFKYAGRDFRLTDVHGTVAREIFT